jgi:hypothetical protein
MNENLRQCGKIGTNPHPTTPPPSIPSCNNDPRVNSLVRFVGQYEGYTGEEYPFDVKFPLIYLGEIPNMRGHCIVADKTGKVFYGYHIENFEEV